MLNWRSSLATAGPDLHTVVATVARDAALHAKHDLAGERVFALVPGLYGSRSVDGCACAPPIRRRTRLPAELPRRPARSGLRWSRRSMPCRISSPQMPTRRSRRAPSRPPPGSTPRRSSASCARTSAASSTAPARHASVRTTSRSSTRLCAYGGSRALWIADASVMPSIPTCNTQAPTVAIAERAASLLA